MESLSAQPQIKLLVCESERGGRWAACVATGVDYSVIFWKEDTFHLIVWVMLVY